MKMRVVFLKAIDLLYWVIVWTGAIGVATVLSSFIGEPLMPYAFIWLGGITLAEVIWVYEFALPYLQQKWREKIARSRAKRPGGAVDYLVSSLETYHRVEDFAAEVDKIFAEKAEGITVKMDGGRDWNIKCPVCGKWEVWPEKACRGSVGLACECGNIQEMHFSEPCTITINEEKADEDATEQD